MKTGAEPLRTLADDRPALITPLRAFPAEPRETERDKLVRRLAADRLRDLRDDGVTLSYIARMYGVETGLMEEMIGELGLGTR
jgi:hypothetical protein